MTVQTDAVIFKVANALMALLFAGGVVVQLNDPDPLRWVAIYVAALAVCVLRAARVAVPLAAPLAVGVVALVWGLAVTAGRPEFEDYRQMFGAWEMKSMAVEEAREATGLFLIAFWMAVLAWTGRNVTRGWQRTGSDLHHGTASHRSWRGRGRDQA